jgi:hypothetical protein
VPHSGFILCLHPRVTHTTSSDFVTLLCRSPELPSRFDCVSLLYISCPPTIHCPSIPKVLGAKFATRFKKRTSYHNSLTWLVCFERSSAGLSSSHWIAPMAPFFVSDRDAIRCVWLGPRTICGREKSYAHMLPDPRRIHPVREERARVVSSAIAVHTQGYAFPGTHTACDAPRAPRPRHCASPCPKGAV